MGILNNLSQINSDKTNLKVKTNCKKDLVVGANPINTNNSRSKGVAKRGDGLDPKHEVLKPKYGKRPKLSKAKVPRTLSANDCERLKLLDSQDDIENDFNNISLQEDDVRVFVSETEANEFPDEEDRRSNTVTINEFSSEKDF